MGSERPPEVDDLVLDDRAEAGPDGITFIGNATTLISVGGIRLLTDPNFLHRGERARLGYGLRSERLTEPAMQLGDLGRIDAVVLSHHHGDHFDDRVAEQLDRLTPIVSTPHAVRKLREQGFTGSVALRRWQRWSIVRGSTTVHLTAMPGVHAPPPLRAFLPPVMGSMLDVERNGRHGFRLYVTGDTLFHPELQEIPKRFPDIDVMLLHLGGTRIMGVLLTMNAEQGLGAVETIDPGVAIPIHYDDYTVFTSPLSELVSLAEASGRGSWFRYLDRGEVFSLTGVDPAVRLGA